MSPIILSVCCHLMNMIEQRDSTLKKIGDIGRFDLGGHHRQPMARRISVRTLARRECAARRDCVHLHGGL